MREGKLDLHGEGPTLGAFGLERDTIVSVAVALALILLMLFPSIAPWSRMNR